MKRELHKHNYYQIATGTIAHFFKFEEIVCGKLLVDDGDGTYSYCGNDINFNLGGVWPMRDNPSSCGILPTRDQLLH